MPRDTFIHWEDETSSDGRGLKSQKPTMDTVYAEAREYLGDFPGATLSMTSRIWIQIPGRCTKYGEDRPRAFEVCVSDDNIDVMTRDMDRMTNAVADGFALRLALKFKGVPAFDAFGGYLQAHEGLMRR